MLLLVLQITNLAVNFLHYVDPEFRIYFANHNSTPNSIETDLEYVDGCYVGEDIPISNECLEDYFLEINSCDAAIYYTVFSYTPFNSEVKHQTKYQKNFPDHSWNLLGPPPKFI